MARSWMILGSSVLVSAVLVTACGDACDDLNDACDACEDPAQKVRCAVIVSEDNAEACQRLLDDPAFQQNCP